MDDNTLPPARGNGAEGVPSRGPERKAGEGIPADQVLRRAAGSGTPNGRTPTVPNGATPNGALGGTPNGASDATSDGASDGPPRRGPKHAAVEPDEFGAYHYDGDEEAGRSPGSALVLVILSLVGGGLYFWQYVPLMRRFNWIKALTLEAPAPFVMAGSVVLIFGAVLLLRYGMVWATRLGCLLILAPMLRLVVDSIIDGGLGWFGPSLVTLTISGLPVILILALTFSPALGRWRRRRQELVKTRRST